MSAESNSEPSVACLALQMAKLYKALGPRIVAVLRDGDRVDQLAGQPNIRPVYITRDGLRWLRSAERLVAPVERETVNLDDLALAFEATYEPSADGWCNRGPVGLCASIRFYRNIFS